MVKEIVTTTATMVDLDRIHRRRTDETGQIIDDFGKLSDKDYWAERAHRRGEASRSRGRSPRIINQAYTNIMMDKENMELSPQRIRNLSNRRTSPTVPGAGASSSCEGPTPRLSMGGENDAVTVGETSDNYMDREDPLSLPLAFVECSTETNVRLEEENQREILQTRAKRKARLSPGVTAFSEGDLEAESAKEESNKITIRKRIDRKKKAKIGTDTSIELTDEVVSIESTSDSDRNAYAKDKEKKRKKEKDKKKSSAKKGTPKNKKEQIIISSEEEDNLGEFAPDELRRMDVTSMGALGIDYLKDVDRMRAKSRNIQGGISGKMRSNLQKATDVINTLIYKVASTGDPAKLKLDNKALKDEIEKLKLEEILRRKEMDEMRAMMKEMKKELEE